MEEIQPLGEAWDITQGDLHLDFRESIFKKTLLSFVLLTEVSAGRQKMTYPNVSDDKCQHIPSLSIIFSCCQATAINNNLINFTAK